MTPSGWWEGRVWGGGWRGSTSRSRLLAGPGRLGWAGTLWIAGGQFRTWSWLSKAASHRGEGRVVTEPGFFCPRRLDCKASMVGLTMVQGQHGWTLPGAGTTWMDSPWGSVNLHLTLLCVPCHTGPTHRHRASSCAQCLLHPPGERQKYSRDWGFYLVLLSQKIHISLQT